MFANKNDLKNNIYNYQIDQITQGDDGIVLQALATAIAEVKSYLQANHKKEYLDGRLRYDVDAIFKTTGDDRNPMILNCVTTIAKWYIIELANVDVLYEVAKERYDRAIQWLKNLNKGVVNLSDLPLLKSTRGAPAGSTTDKEPFIFGSRKKFNHE